MGSRAYLDGPYGDFTLDLDDTSPLVLIAGGVGMAPVMALLRELRSQGTRRPIRLIQGNRVADQILFAEELEFLADTLDLTVHHVLSEPPDADWSGHVGILDRSVLEACIPPGERSTSVYYVCGPPAMIDTVENTLRTGFRVPLSQVFSERFRYTLGAHTGNAGRLQRAMLAAACVLILAVLAFAVR